MFLSYRRYLVEFESNYNIPGIIIFYIFFSHMHWYVRVSASKFHVLNRSGSRDTTPRLIVRFIAGPARTHTECCTEYTILMVCVRVHTHHSSTACCVLIMLGGRVVSRGGHLKTNTWPRTNPNIAASVYIWGSWSITSPTAILKQSRGATTCFHYWSDLGYVGLGCALLLLLSLLLYVLLCRHSGVCELVAGYHGSY